MNTATIEVEQLTVRYGDRVAVDNLSLSVNAGETLALLGPNGAGKTTTVETIEGYRRPTSGTVRVLGMDPVRQHRRLVERMGVMLQEGGIYRAMGPGEALALFASYYTNPRSPDELLELVDLGDQRRTPWRNLSGGEQQRLSLALALVGRPEVLILDEPTSGLDPGGRRSLRAVLTKLGETGHTVLITTHDLEEAERSAQRVAILVDGRLRADGPLEQLLAQGRPGSREIRFRAATRMASEDLQSHLRAPVAEVAAGEYVIRAEPTPQRLAELTAWMAARDLELGEVRTGRHSLEDLYLRLVEDGGDTGPLPGDPG